MRHDDSFHNNERDKNEKFVNLFQQESPDNNNQATKCQVRPTQSTNNNPISNQQLSSNQQVQINNQQPTIKHQIIVNNHTNKINTTNKQLTPNDVLINDDLVNVSYNSDSVIVGEWENNYVTKRSLASLQPRTWIGDEITNFYYARLKTVNEHACCITNSFFLTKLIIDSGNYDFYNIVGWIPSNMFEKKK